jgi:hypothetical protein
MGSGPPLRGDRNDKLRTTDQPETISRESINQSPHESLFRNPALGTRLE